MSNMIQDIGAIPVLIMKIMAVNKVIQKQGLSIKSLLPSYTGHKDFEKRTDVIIKTMSNIIQDISAIRYKDHGEHRTPCQLCTAASIEYHVPLPPLTT